MAESQKRAIERKRIEALLVLLGNYDGKKYRIESWPEDADRTKPKPDVIFVDENDNHCGVIEETKSAEYGQADFEFEAAFPHFVRDLIHEQRLSDELNRKRDAYTLHVPKPASLPKKGHADWNDIVSCLLRAIQSARLVYEEDGREYFPFLWRGQEYAFLRRVHPPSGILVTWAISSEPPSAQALEPRLEHIAKKQTDGLPILGLIDILPWLGGEYADPETLARDLRPKYSQIASLFLISFAPSEQRRAPWERVDDYDLLRIW